MWYLQQQTMCNQRHVCCIHSGIAALLPISAFEQEANGSMEAGKHTPLVSWAFSLMVPSAENTPYTVAYV
jgi:hypothetical protein